MKIVLVNPISSEGQLTSPYRRLLTPVPPASLCCLASFLEKHQHKVAIIDQYAYRLSNKVLLSTLDTLKPDFIGFSCLTSCLNTVIALSREIKLRNTNTKIILGNIHPTLFPDEVLKQSGADLVIRGEGEHAVVEVVDACFRGSDLSEIKGISYVSDGNVFHNPDRNPIDYLDELTYPAWNLLKLECYARSPLLNLRELALPVQASRGCVFNCAFCAQEKMHSGISVRNIKKVVEEISHMHNRYKVNNFVFIDAHFPINNQAGYEFCEEFMSRDLHKKIRWVTEIRVDQANFKLIKMMKKAGLYMLMFGFESGSQRMLDAMDKRITLEQSRNIMHFVRQAGVLTLGLFIIGMPGETKDSCNETIRFAKELDCDMAKFNIAIPYPGTRFYETYKDKINPRCTFQDFSSWDTWLSTKKKLVYVPEGMTETELIRMQHKAMFSYYFRPKIIWRIILLHRIEWSSLLYGGYFLALRFLKLLMFSFLAEERDSK